MSKRVLDFPSFYNRLASQKRHICDHALTWPFPGDSYKAGLVFQLTSSSARCSLPLSVTHFKLVVASLNTFSDYPTVGVLLHNCC
ncbi:unnamed protein product [Hymenolepis diminuta]|uniref:Uncharacterized protein n=1 Tax=Hymenolepis diminuta TaxID=6216 RepID=A0A564YDR6_HYMDI|nr:unnamed protein product [Hymenolepis diminuta]